MNHGFTIVLLLLAGLVRSVPAAPPEEKVVEKAPAGPQEDLVEVKAFDAGTVRRPLKAKAYSADKAMFAGWYRDGWDEVISIHDAKTGKQVRRIVGHGDEVVELKFTPDGKILASRCVNKGRSGWALWDVKTGELLLRLPVPVEEE